jgi:hypothetical protein
MTTTGTEAKYVIEYGKLGMLALVILGGFVLIILSITTMDADDSRFGPILALGSAQIAGSVGYLTGNGILASRGQASVPTIAATPARVAATALETGELANVPTGELIERKAAMRQQEQTSAVLHGLAAVTAELERRTA